MKDIIPTLRQQEYDADKAEDVLKRKAFALGNQPITVFHTVRLAETIGGIADHAQNAGDMMRAMVAK